MTELLAMSGSARVRATLMRAERPMTTGEIALATRVSPNSVSRYLCELRNQGRVRRNGARWEVVPGVDITLRKLRTRRIVRDAPIKGSFMLTGPGPRRDCVHEVACMSAAARATADEAHCPASCPHFAPLSQKRITEDDTRSGYSRWEHA